MTSSALVLLYLMTYRPLHEDSKTTALVRIASVGGEGPPWFKLALSISLPCSYLQNTKLG